MDNNFDEDYRKEKADLEAKLNGMNREEQDAFLENMKVLECTPAAHDALEATYGPMTQSKKDVLQEYRQQLQYSRDKEAAQQKANLLTGALAATLSLIGIVGTVMLANPPTEDFVDATVKRVVETEKKSIVLPSFPPENEYSVEWTRVPEKDITRITTTRIRQVVHNGRVNHLFGEKFFEATFQGHTLMQYGDRYRGSINRRVWTWHCTDAESCSWYQSKALKEIHALQTEVRMRLYKPR